MAPVKKLREVFVLHPVMEKNLSQFLKFIFICPENGLGRRHAEQAKMVKNEKSGFFSGWVVFRTPPEVVSGFFFFLGGGGPLECGADTCLGGGF
jgi:hypothetical protein